MTAGRECSTSPWTDGRMSPPAGVVAGSSSSLLSAPRTHAMIRSRSVLLASIGRPRIIAPVALVSADINDTATDFAETIVPVAVTTGLMLVIDLPAMMVPKDVPVTPVSKLQMPAGELLVVVVCVMMIVLPGLVGASDCELRVQVPLYL